MINEFDNKAKDYSKGRPSYPIGILNKLNELGLNTNSNIADIGAGTGLLTNVLCKLGAKVFAVEPNSEMLYECINQCNHDNIEFICATAEKTTLKDNSIDAITIGQAFHWFNKKLCKVEFKRVLKKSGYIFTIWNSLQEDSSFTKEYMNLIRQYEIKTTSGNSYFNPHKEKLDFFGKDYDVVYYDNYQSVDLDALVSNALSISYTPSNTDIEYNDFSQKIKSLFNKYQNDGVVTFHYITEMCIG